MIKKLCVALLFMSVTAFAQTPNQPAPPQLPPQLNELEQAKVELLQLKIRDINVEASGFTAKFEADHPGFTINIMAGQVMPKPKPFEPPPSPKKTEPAKK